MRWDEGTPNSENVCISIISIIIIIIDFIVLYGVSISYVLVQAILSLFV